MNDRFKFRGYWYNDVQKEWWVYDNPQFITGDGTAQIWYDTEGGAYPELPSDAELHLCQCTGLNDKNGTLIYEGDIINIWCKNYTKNQISEVKFNETRAAFTFDYFTDFGNIVPCTMEKTEIEVIGNIYENKELLEDTECQK